MIVRLSIMKEGNLVYQEDFGSLDNTVMDTVAARRAELLCMLSKHEMSGRRDDNSPYLTFNDLVVIDTFCKENGVEHKLTTNLNQIAPEPTIDHIATYFQA